MGWPCRNILNPSVSFCSSPTVRAKGPGLGAPPGAVCARRRAGGLRSEPPSGCVRATAGTCWILPTKESDNAYVSIAARTTKLCSVNRWAVSWALFGTCSNGCIRGLWAPALAAAGEIDTYLPLKKTRFWHVAGCQLAPSVLERAEGWEPLPRRARRRDSPDT